jgi:hypothetical protein
VQFVGGRRFDFNANGIPPDFAERRKRRLTVAFESKLIHFESSRRIAAALLAFRSQSPAAFRVGTRSTA